MNSTNSVSVDNRKTLMKQVVYQQSITYTTLL